MDPTQYIHQAETTGPILHVSELRAVAPTEQVMRVIRETRNANIGVTWVAGMYYVKVLCFTDEAARIAARALLDGGVQLLPVDDLPEVAATTSLVVDTGGGTSQPMIPPAALGAAFAAVIAEALSWSEQARAEIQARHDDAVARNPDAYAEAVERLDDALANAGLDWSCQFGEPDHPAESEPYVATLRHHQMRGAADVAAAVLARDLNLITEADFRTITGWYTDIDLPVPPLPPARARARFAADVDQVEWNASDLLSNRYRIPGWPLAAVA